MPRISSYYFDEHAFTKLPLDEQLWHSVQQNEMSRAEDLLLAGAPPGKRMGVWMQTPLHHALKKKNIAMVQLLLKYEPDIDDRDITGTTPLMLAVQWNSFWAVSWLSERGANARRKNCDGKTAIEMAQEIVDLYGPESDTFPDAAAVLFDLQKKNGCLPKSDDAADSKGAVESYLSRLLAARAPSQGRTRARHTLTKAEKDQMREKKGERALRAEREKKERSDHFAERYGGH